MKIAYLFPGQGAQHVGMGKDVYEKFEDVRALFGRAESATGLAIGKLCFEGPLEELSRTDLAQPAIFTVSAAMLAAMKAPLGPEFSAAGQPAMMAGLSLGEYTALYAAGAIDFEAGVRLVTRRGELMQQAAVARPSGMVSVLGMDEPKARQLADAAAEGQILACANFNCPGQIVLSGEKDACLRAAEMAKDFGASGAVPLKVAGAFHCEIMAPAAEKFADALAEVDFKPPKVAVISNVDAQASRTPQDIRDKLLSQLTSPVRWQQSVEAMLAEGAGRFFEIGPGKVLRGLLRRIDRKAEVTCLNSLAALEKLGNSESAT